MEMQNIDAAAVAPLCHVFGSKGVFLAYYAVETADAAEFDRFMLSDLFWQGIHAFLESKPCRTYTRVHVDFYEVPEAHVPSTLHRQGSEPLVYYRLYLQLEFGQKVPPLRSAYSGVKGLIPTLFESYISMKGEVPPTLISVPMDFEERPFDQAFPEIELWFDAHAFAGDYGAFLRRMKTPLRCRRFERCFILGFLTPIEAFRIIERTGTSPMIRNRFTHEEYSTDDWVSLVASSTDLRKTSTYSHDALSQKVAACPTQFRVRPY